MRTALVSAVAAVVLSGGIAAPAQAAPVHAPAASVQAISISGGYRPQGLGTLLCAWLTYMCNY